MRGYAPFFLCLDALRCCFWAAISRLQLADGGTVTHMHPRFLSVCPMWGAGCVATEAEGGRSPRRVLLAGRSLTGGDEVRAPARFWFPPFGALRDRFYCLSAVFPTRPSVFTPPSPSPAPSSSPSLSLQFPICTPNHLHDMSGDPRLIVGSTVHTKAKNFRSAFTCTRMLGTRADDAWQPAPSPRSREPRLMVAWPPPLRGGLSAWVRPLTRPCVSAASARDLHPVRFPPFPLHLHNWFRRRLPNPLPTPHFRMHLGSGWRPRDPLRMRQLPARSREQVTRWLYPSVLKHRPTGDQLCFSKVLHCWTRQERFPLVPPSRHHPPTIWLSVWGRLQIRRPRLHPRQGPPPHRPLWKPTAFCGGNGS